MTRNPFEDLGGLFDSARPTTPPAAPKTEKGVPIRGRRIDGNQYVRAADMIAYLDANSIKLPGLLKALRLGARSDAS